jgi:hypothetical protein
MIENGRIWGQIADLFDRSLMDAASVKQVCCWPCIMVGCKHVFRSICCRFEPGCMVLPCTAGLQQGADCWPAQDGRRAAICHSASSPCTGGGFCRHTAAGDCPRQRPRSGGCKLSTCLQMLWQMAVAGADKQEVTRRHTKGCNCPNAGGGHYAAGDASSGHPCSSSNQPRIRASGACRQGHAASARAAAAAGGGASPTAGRCSGGTPTPAYRWALRWSACTITRAPPLQPR